MEALQKIKQIAEREKTTPTILSLSWCLKNEAITCVIPGTRNLSQLESIFEAAVFNLSDEVYKELCEVTEPIKVLLGTTIDIYESAATSRSK